MELLYWWERAHLPEQLLHLLRQPSVRMLFVQVLQFFD